MAEKTVEVLFRRIEKSNCKIDTYLVEPVLKLRNTTR